MKRINIGYPDYFEKQSGPSTKSSAELDCFCSGLKPNEFWMVWHFPIACLRLGGGDLDTPREALIEALKLFIDIEFCPARDDKTHCEHWYDGEPCCNCDSNEGCIGPECNCGKPDCSVRGHIEIEM